MKTQIVSYLLATAGPATAAAIFNITDSGIIERAADQTYGPNKLDTYASGSPFLTLDNGYRVFFQNSDGNFVVYDGNCAAWDSGATHSPNCANNACQLIFQGDGNLVAYAGSSVFWATNTNGKGASLVFSDTQPLVAIYDAQGGEVWSTGDVNHCVNSGSPPPPPSPPTGGGYYFYGYDD